jgi:hypothetical protein
VQERTLAALAQQHGLSSPSHACVLLRAPAASAQRLLLLWSQGEEELLERAVAQRRRQPPQPDVPQPAEVAELEAERQQPGRGRKRQVLDRIRVGGGGGQAGGEVAAPGWLLVHFGLVVATAAWAAPCQGLSLTLRATGGCHCGRRLQTQLRSPRRTTTPSPSPPRWTWPGCSGWGRPGSRSQARGRARRRRRRRRRLRGRWAGPGLRSRGWTWAAASTRC